MNTPTFSDKVYNLWVLLQQAGDTMFRVREKELAEHGITPAETMALFVIQTAGENAMPIEISRWMLREPHTITGLLNRMENRGLITKSKDPHNKHLVRVSSTEKGKQAYYKSSGNKLIRNVISALSEEEQQQLGTYLQKLRDRALEELEIEYEVPFPPRV